jgi:uncharacterized protein YbaP (TraB family)
MWKRILAAPSLVFMALVFTAGAAQARPPIWIVSDKDSELVLFGSVHVLPPGLDWRPPALQSALGRADDLWFELPIDPASEAETARLAGKLGVLAPDKSLYKMLPADDVARLSRVAAAYNVSPALLDRFQPWLAEVALAGAAYRRSGAGGDDGVEKAISASAPTTAARRAFETPAEQLGFFSDTPLNDQIASLRQTLQEMEDEPDEFAILLRAWLAGDLATLDREALSPLRKASPVLFKRLVTDRNARWAVKLDQRLKGKGRTVVVVGVGHLIGEDSLPDRLRALGYSVKGP